MPKLVKLQVRSRVKNLGLERLSVLIDNGGPEEVLAIVPPPMFRYGVERKSASKLALNVGETSSHHLSRGHPIVKIAAFV